MFLDDRNGGWKALEIGIANVSARSGLLVALGGPCNRHRQSAGPVKGGGDVRTVATQAKLGEPVEIAGPIPANPISSTPWIICLRSGATEESKRYSYSAFFKDNYLRIVPNVGFRRSLRKSGFFTIREIVLRADSMSSAETIISRMADHTHVVFGYSPRMRGPLSTMRSPLVATELPCISSLFQSLSSLCL